jgi:hypothetical protein
MFDFKSSLRLEIQTESSRQATLDTAEQRDELAAFQFIDLHSIRC